ncbi:hypothetical protein ACGBVF_003886 [Acinetobacter baumannii]
MTDGVNYADLSREVLFKAFLLWLTKIGYRGIVRPCGRMEFYCATVSKLFPRNVHIMYDGKMNKAATERANKKLEGCILVPRTRKVVVTIEKIVQQQCDASGVQEPLHRLDGWRILEEIAEKVEEIK